MELSRIKIFADGASLPMLRELASNPRIAGYTTNPTLMRKAGVTDYREFARAALEIAGNKPISFEVFADEFPEMERQARAISSFGDNVYVKIPVMNTKTQSDCPLIRRLAERGVKINVTAMMTSLQVREVVANLNPAVPSYVSVFAGRIADTGRDPLPIMTESVAIAARNALCEVIWASPRELLNIFEADRIGCQVITVTGDILKKLSLVGYDLDAYSLDTVKTFYKDAVEAGFKI